MKAHLWLDTWPGSGVPGPLAWAAELACPLVAVVGYAAPVEAKDL